MGQNADITPESLAWLRHAAANGVVYAQVILALIERLEALEAQRETEKAAILDVYELLDELKARADRHYLRIRALEGDPIQQPGKDAEDDEEPQALHTVALKMVDTLERLNVLPEILDTIRRAIREPMESLAQPAPPAAPAGGLVWRVAMAIGLDSEPLNWAPEARAAIREVAAWLDSRGQHGCSLWLREEVGR